MKAVEAMIAWTPARDTDVSTCGAIVIGLWPDTQHWSRPYRMTSGACMASWRRLKGDTLKLRILSEWHALVVRDGLDAQKAHTAFLNIDEYRLAIAPDVQGAD